MDLKLNQPQTKQQWPLKISRVSEPWMAKLSIHGCTSAPDKFLVAADANQATYSSI
ncbi:MAG: hypothetical protein ACI9E9_002230 [Reinekea sp.]